MSKQCSKCKEMKDDFPNNKSYCRKCGNEMCRDYKRRNKEKISSYNKEYKAFHKEEINVYNHDYNIKNRQAIQERQTKTHKERRANDENYKLACKIKKVLRVDVKKEFNILDTNCLKKYSCKSKFIKKWFEHLFEGEMNWSNHGSLWNIDHIKPCCTFDLTIEGESKILSHWSNLRPVYILDNQKKNGKFDDNLIEKYKIIASQFIENYNETSNY